MTTRMADVVNALADLFGAAPSLSSAEVLDGPPVTGDPLHEAVFVGYDGDPDGDGEAATFTQEWAGLGARAKDEAIAVTCAVLAWSGDNDAEARRAARVRAADLLGAVEDVLRDNPCLGFPPPTLSALVSGQMYQRQHGGGFEARIPFQVQVQIRI